MHFTKSQDRNTWYHPDCEQSKALLRLFNRKALKQHEIDSLIKDGFTINLFKGE